MQSTVLKMSFQPSRVSKGHGVRQSSSKNVWRTIADTRQKRDRPSIALRLHVSNLFSIVNHYAFDNNILNKTACSYCDLIKLRFQKIHAMNSLTRMTSVSLSTSMSLQI